MSDCYFTTPDEESISIVPLTGEILPLWLSAQTESLRNWLVSVGFDASRGRICLIPDKSGHPATVVFGVQSTDDIWPIADLPTLLPAGKYQLADEAKLFSPELFSLALLAWGIGSYQFDKYRQMPVKKQQLFLPDSDFAKEIREWMKTNHFLRNLINTPTEDMGPEQLVAEVAAVGKQFQASLNILKDKELLKHGFNAIHAVGRSSDRSSYLVDLQWGDKSHPKLTLVGKGVCFDSGGYDLKSADAMRLMKKDMSGAAHALALARMVMACQLPYRLRLLIPAVENVVSGNSFLPGAVIKTHAGINVEVDNTDAEGRLILCDALSLAINDKPDLLFDFASLTGAATIALGPQIAAMYTFHDGLASGLIHASEKVKDPIWRMPFYMPYTDYLKSDIADVSNSAAVRYAGSITGALFLQYFVPKEIKWAHFDMCCWNYESSLGRTRGAAMMAIRAVFDYLKK